MEFDFIPNIISFVVFLTMGLFIFIYTKYADWTLTRPGRSVLFMAGAWALNLAMNTFHLFVGRYPGIWITRSVVFAILAAAAYYLVHTLISEIRNHKPLRIQDVWDYILRRPRDKEVDKSPEE